MLWKLRSGASEIQLRILQSLLPLIANYPEKIHGKQLRLLFAIALSIYNDKNAAQMVHHTAVASIRQLATSVFERVEKNAHVTKDVSTTATPPLSTTNQEMSSQKMTGISPPTMEDAVAFLKVHICISISISRI